MAIDLSSVADIVSGGKSGGGNPIGTIAGAVLGGLFAGPGGVKYGAQLGGALLGGGDGEEKAEKRIVSIAAFPCPKVDDKGLSKAWFWADKIAQAAAVWATWETYKAAQEDYKIAKRYHELAKEQWDLHREHYHPLEQQELDEIWAEQPYSPDYPTAINGHTHTIDNLFATADKQRNALMEKYCVCPDVSQFTKTGIMQSTVFGDSDNFARRYAEKLAQERNDIRWARRISAAARGRGLLSESASHAQRASNSMGAYAGAMGGLASSAMQFSGYINNRHRTEYNGARERFNSRAETFNVDKNTNVQERVRGINFATEPRGGITWGSGGSAYMQSGVDPTSYISVGGSIR